MTARVGQTHLAMDSSRMQSRSMLPQFKAMAELSYLQQPSRLSCTAMLTNPTTAPLASKQASKSAVLQQASASAGAKYRDTGTWASEARLCCVLHCKAASSRCNRPASRTKETIATHLHQRLPACANHASWADTARHPTCNQEYILKQCTITRYAHAHACSATSS